MSVVAVRARRSLEQALDEAVREAGSWTLCLLPEVGADDLVTAVQQLLEDVRMVEDGGEVERVPAGPGLPDALRQRAGRGEGAAAAVVLVTGLSDLDDADLARIDLLRARMVPGPTVVAIAAEADVGRLRAAMPNLWSVLGGRVFPVERTAAPVAERCAALAAELQLDEAALLAGVRSGELALDPPVVEWLALLGRGDLLRRRAGEEPGGG